MNKIPVEMKHKIHVISCDVLSTHKKAGVCRAMEQLLEHGFLLLLFNFQKTDGSK